MAEGKFLEVRVNDKCRPIERGDYEDPLDDALKALDLGEVTGGGTQFNEDRVIEYCYIDVSVTGDLNEAKKVIKNTLEGNGLPKGSKIIVEGQEFEIGNHEVMAFHFDNVGLADSVYEEHDINDVLDEIESLIGNSGRRNSHAIIKDEVVVYYGGESFKEMKEKVTEYVEKHQLCENGRITQAA